MRLHRVIMGIDPGLAHTGWGLIRQNGSKLGCLAYGCVTTTNDRPLEQRLKTIYDQVDAVIDRFHPTAVGIETVWLGANTTAAFATGQARGAALVACANAYLNVGEFAPNQIKNAVVGTGHADKHQVAYMVAQILHLDELPTPDHASDALAAAICYDMNDRIGHLEGKQVVNQ